MKKLSIAMVASLAGLAFVAVGMRNSAVAATIASQPVYRLYNRNTGEHFYTTSAAERNVDVAAGWTYESIGWTAPKTSSQPIYRVYNPNAKGGDHYYTKSKGEAQVLVGLGWKWDNAGKPVFYSGGTDKVYVAYNPNAQSGAHNYTTNAFEQKSLLNEGWKFSAVAWNALTKSDLTPTVGPTAPTFSNKLNLEVARGDSLTAANPENTYTFTAPSAGTYYFMSNGSLDTIGNLFNNLNTQIVYNDEAQIPNGNNFGFYYVMAAGQTVTLKVWGHNALNYGNYTVLVHRPVNKTEQVTVNKDQNGNTLPSTTDYTKYTQLSSSTSSTSAPAINGDTTTRTTTTVLWKANPTVSTPSLTLDVAKSGNISTAGQINTYTFTAPSAGTYTFYSTSSLDTYGILLGSNGAQLNRNDDYQSGKNTNFSLSQTLSAGQTVTLKVGTYNSNTGAYNLMVHQPKNTVTNVTVNQDQNGNTLNSTTGYTKVSSSSASSTSAPAINGDTTTTKTTTVVWKQNAISGTTIATALNLSLNSPVTVNATTANPVWYYKFTAPSDAMYSFTSSNAATNADPQADLLDANGKQLTSDDDSTGGHNFNMSNYHLIAGQVVYVKAYYYSSFAGNYTLTATSASINTPVTKTVTRTVYYKTTVEALTSPETDSITATGQMNNLTGEITWDNPIINFPALSAPSYKGYNLKSNDSAVSVTLTDDTTDQTATGTVWYTADAVPGLPTTNLSQNWNVDSYGAHYFGTVHVVIQPGGTGDSNSSPLDGPAVTLKNVLGAGQSTMIQADWLKLVSQDTLQYVLYANKMLNNGTNTLSKGSDSSNQSLVNAAANYCVTIDQEEHQNYGSGTQVIGGGGLVTNFGTGVAVYNADTAAFVAQWGVDQWLSEQSSRNTGTTGHFMAIQATGPQTSKYIYGAVGLGKSGIYNVVNFEAN